MWIQRLVSPTCCGGPVLALALMCMGVGVLYLTVSAAAPGLIFISIGLVAEGFCLFLSRTRCIDSY